MKDLSARCEKLARQIRWDGGYEQSPIALVESLEAFAREIHNEALEEAAKVADEEGRSNVENPAIDMFEYQRRSGIRWCGEWTARKIRSLKTDAENEL